MKHKSEDLKIQAVKYYMKIKNYKNVCNIFECSERSLKRWINRYIETKNIKNIKRYGSYKVKNIYINEIKNILKNNPDIFIKEVHKKLKDKFKNYNISEKHLYDVIRDNNITRKRKTNFHFPLITYGKPRNRKKELELFFEKIKKYNINKIISIDETSIKGGLSHNYSYCDLGKRCIVKTNNNLIFKKYTLVVAISNRETIDYNIYNKGGMDKMNEVRNFIKSSGNDYLYILPYHHYLNPIEEYFNQLKHYIKLDKPLEFEDIKRSIEKSINNIKINNYNNYFLHSFDIKQLIKSKKISTKRKKLKIYI